ncbi:MAG: hypothetical protein ACYC1M_17905 [Armatimonadota bacterium]
MNKSPEFVFANAMPIKKRYALMIICAVVGIIVQFVFAPIIGWVWVLAAALLGLLKGRSNVPKFTRESEWKSVTINEFNGLLDMLRESTDVKKAAGLFSLSSGSGCLMFIGIIILLIFAAANLMNSGSDSFDPSPMVPIMAGGSMSTLFVMDAVTLLLPLWISGTVKSWEPVEMRTKINQLIPIYNMMADIKDVTFQPSIQIAQTANGSVPVDVKMMAKLAGAPEDFYGIQIQTTMNTVQSTKYPYTYCVLIAKPSYGLVNRVRPLLTKADDGILTGFLTSLKDKNTQKEARIPRFGEVLVELKKEGEVEIAVMRQGTGGQGYTTSPDATASIFASALKLARKAME